MTGHRMAVALAAGLTLVAAGCGGDGEQATTTTTMPSTTSSSSTSTSSTTTTTTMPSTTSSSSTSTSSTTTTTSRAQPETSTWDVVLVGDDDVLNVRVNAGVGNEIVATLAPTATGIEGTGDETVAGDDVWREIIVDGKVGWAHGEFLTPSVESGFFVEDPAVDDLLDRFADAMESGSGFSDVVSPKDLWVAHFGEPREFGRDDLSGRIGSDEELTWNGPACIDCITATFRETVVEDYVSVVEAPELRLAYDSLVTGTFSSASIPARFANFHFVSLHDPGDEGDNLDWRTWNVYIDYVDGSPMVVGLSADQWSP